MASAEIFAATSSFTSAVELLNAIGVKVLRRLLGRVVPKLHQRVRIRPRGAESAFLRGPQRETLEFHAGCVSAGRGGDAWGVPAGTSGR